MLPLFHITLRICHYYSIDDFIRSSKRIDSIEHAHITLGRSYEAAITLRSCASNCYSTQTALHCKMRNLGIVQALKTANAGHVASALS
jgi:hypothetical protein